MVALGAPRSARADRIVATADDYPGITLSYLWDGGALPLFWGALAGQLAIDRWATAPSTPLWFRSTEGGASRASWEVPSWTLTIGGLSLGTAFLLSGDQSRWYHVKGLAETYAVNTLMTTALKRTFGRHRPDWTADSTDPGRDESFVSGHSTNTFSILTYATLYLRYHVFDEYRRPGTLPWWEGVTYAGILAGAVALDAERVIHHRHHVSDVVVGSLLGATEATLLFMYQEHRFRSRNEHALTITPVITENGASLQLGGTF